MTFNQMSSALRGRWRNRMMTVWKLSSSEIIRLTYGKNTPRIHENRFQKRLIWDDGRMVIVRKGIAHYYFRRTTVTSKEFFARSYEHQQRKRFLVIQITNILKLEDLAFAS